MSDADFRNFVGGLLPAHLTWLNNHAHPNGTEFLDHYVGDAGHQDGLLWQYQLWRSEHGYTRVRAWNGAEALGRAVTATIPFPGTIIPYLGTANAAGPSIDARLASTGTTASLQAAFGVGNVDAL